MISGILPLEEGTVKRNGSALGSVLCSLVGFMPEQVRGRAKEPFVER